MSRAIIGAKQMEEILLLMPDDYISYGDGWYYFEDKWYGYLKSGRKIGPYNTKDEVKKRLYNPHF